MSGQTDEQIEQSATQGQGIEKSIGSNTGLLIG
jgi:hypothetical protein